MNSCHENQSKYGRICTCEFTTVGSGTKSGVLPLIATAGICEGPPVVVVKPHGESVVCCVELTIVANSGGSASPDPETTVNATATTTTQRERTSTLMGSVLSG